MHIFMKDVCYFVMLSEMVQRAVALLQAASLLFCLGSSERLVWSEEFDSVDESVWIHEVTTFPQANIYKLMRFSCLDLGVKLWQ